MPKSKRDRKVTLTKTSKKGGLEFKQGLVQRIRESVDTYSNLYVFSVDNMRNNHFKAVREAWKNENRRATFFMCKNRVMALALGREEEEEYNDNLHKVSKLLRGPNRGLMLTNEEQKVVEEFFEEFEEPDFLRTGGTALEDVDIPEGALKQFGHAMEPQLRALGLPTELKKGVIHLMKDYRVCKQGEKLTAQQAQILKLFEYRHASFKIDIVAAWSKKRDGSADFQLLMENAENGDNEEADDNDSNEENDSMEDD